MSLLVALGAVAAAVFAYHHRQTLLAQQQQQPQCPRPNFAVLPHEEPVEALQPAPSPLPSLSPASWGSAISSAMWMLFLKRKPLRYHGERLLFVCSWLLLAAVRLKIASLLLSCCLVVE